MPKYGNVPNFELAFAPTKGILSTLTPRKELNRAAYL